MLNKTTNRGFIFPDITPDQYWGHLGGGIIPYEEIRPDADWRSCLPEIEIQETANFDTFNCTGFGLTNIVEITLNHFGIDKNFSDRGLGIAAGTKPPGNDPQVVAEALRKFGLLLEEKLPITGVKTLEEYFGPNPLPQELLDLMKKFFDEFEFKHEWIILPTTPIEQRPAILRKYLKTSPIGVAVYAWQKENGFYVNPGLPDNHWTTLVYAPQSHYEIFDTYPDDTGVVKKLSPNFQFNLAKRYYIRHKATGTMSTVSPFQALILWLRRMVKLHQ